MALARKTIWDALEARLATVEGVVTCSQRVVLFSDCPIQNQPAVYIQPGQQTAQHEPGKPLVWTLTADVMVYVWDDGDNGPSGTLQTLIDRIEAALEATAAEKHAAGQRFPRSDFATTLGGSVAGVRLVSVETDEGALSPQAVAVLSITILTVA